MNDARHVAGVPAEAPQKWPKARALAKKIDALFAKAAGRFGYETYTEGEGPAFVYLLAILAGVGLTAGYAVWVHGLPEEIVAEVPQVKKAPEMFIDDTTLGLLSVGVGIGVVIAKGLSRRVDSDGIVGLLTAGTFLTAASLNVFSYYSGHDSTLGWIAGLVLAVFFAVGSLVASLRLLRPSVAARKQPEHAPLAGEVGGAGAAGAQQEAALSAAPEGPISREEFETLCSDLQQVIKKDDLRGRALLKLVFSKADET
jgi:hypothetical protein